MPGHQHDIQFTFPPNPTIFHHASAPARGTIGGPSNTSSSQRTSSSSRNNSSFPPTHLHPSAPVPDQPTPASVLQAPVEASAGVLDSSSNPSSLSLAMQGHNCSMCSNMTGSSMSARHESSVIFEDVEHLCPCILVFEI
jgi:hypothetical protein